MSISTTLSFIVFVVSNAFEKNDAKLFEKVYSLSSTLLEPELPVLEYLDLKRSKSEFGSCFASGT